MKDPHERIASWFTLLAEYDFEIFYRAGRENAWADFPSRPVELMVVDENQPFKAHIKAIAHYLDNLSVVDEPISITPELKKKRWIFWFTIEDCSAALNTVSVLYLTYRCWGES